MKLVRVHNETKDGVAADRVRVARSIWARFWGLMGKRDLGGDDALLIDPCSSIHTMFMRFTIDVVFLDKENRVLKVSTVKPWRAALAGGCKRVIEMPPGDAAQRGIEPGDQLRFEAADQR